LKQYTIFKVLPFSGAAMFEAGFFSVILLAVGYWVVLWIMRRRNDVLHGHFVEPEPRPVSATTSAPASRPARLPRNAEALRPLLASIERELKRAARR
jgi:hypothetical protein